MASFTLIEIVSALAILSLMVVFGSKLSRADDGSEAVRIAERIFFDTLSYARFRAIYYRSLVRIMVDMSEDSEYLCRKIIVALRRPGGEAIWEKQKEVLLPQRTFFIPKASIGSILSRSSNAKYLWNSCSFIDGGKTLTMAFREIDGIGLPLEDSSSRYIAYVVGYGSCRRDASNKFKIEFQKNTQIQGGVLLPSGTIIAMDSTDKIAKLLE